MKKAIIALLLVLGFWLVTPTFASHYENFLASAITVGKGTTKTNGTDFTSASLWTTRFEGQRQTIGSIIVTFTRAAGSASTVDFSFEASYDGGTTWATLEDGDFKVATNHAVVSGTTVRVLKIYNLFGVTHLRLKSIVNNDSSNDLTAVNATLSLT